MQVKANKYLTHSKRLKIDGDWMERWDRFWVGDTNQFV